MDWPTCPECGAALPSCPWTGPPVVCLECRTAFGRRPRRPSVRLLLLAAALAAVLAVAGGF